MVTWKDEYMTSEKVREIRLRRWANRLGLFLHKSRARRWSVENYQGYMITDPNLNTIVQGQRYELDLVQVEQFLSDYELEIKQQAKWAK
jgi:hypothetical protein